MALVLHENITEYKPDGWRGNTLKEKKIKKIITNELEKVGKDDSKEVERVFELVKNQNEY